MCILCTGEYNIDSRNISIFACDQLVDCDILTNFPNLNCVYINGCKNLKSFPVLDNLITLLITDCPDIEEIPFMYSLKFLNCAKCINLISLPEIPTITDLICAGTSILTIPECYKKLKFLNISDCYSLEFVPDMYKNIEIIANFEEAKLNKSQYQDIDEDEEKE